MTNRTKKMLAVSLTTFVLIFMAAVSASALGYGDKITAWVNKHLPAKFTALTPKAQVESPIPVQVSLQNTAPLTQNSAPQFSAQQAIEIVQAKFPRSAVKGAPEMVDYNGVLAYEVQLSSGKVYVDVNQGNILSPMRAAAAVDNSHNSIRSNETNLVESRAEKPIRLDDKFNGDEERNSHDGKYREHKYREQGERHENEQHHDKRSEEEDEHHG